METLYYNASVNLYMYHGGTSFGFMSGANGDQGTYYSPQVTSYDYGTCSHLPNYLAFE